MARDVRRAVAAREAALARVRRVTVGLVAAGVGLTGAFSSLAASSTHFGKATVRVVHRTRPRPHRTAHPAPVRAPVPPLVGASSPAPTPPASSSSSPAPAPAPVAPASTPVVVSGGS